MRQDQDVEYTFLSIGCLMHSDQMRMDAISEQGCQLRNSLAPNIERQRLSWCHASCNMYTRWCAGSNAEICRKRNIDLVRNKIIMHLLLTFRIFYAQNMRWCIPDRRLTAVVDLQIKIITSMCIIAVHMLFQPPLEYIYSQCIFIYSPSTFELAQGGKIKVSRV